MGSAVADTTILSYTLSTDQHDDDVQEEASRTGVQLHELVVPLPRYVLCYELPHELDQYLSYRTAHIALIVHLTAVPQIDFVLVDETAQGDLLELGRRFGDTSGPPFHLSRRWLL